MKYKKPVSEATLLRWNRQCLSGEATQATKVKLVSYVREMSRAFGMVPSKLMYAYHEVSADVPYDRVP
jgi:hypothetical protein